MKQLEHSIMRVMGAMAANIEERRCWMSGKESQTNRGTFPLTDLRHEAINDDARLITEIEAADLLALSVKTLRNWRLSGHGPPYFKVGRLVRYRLCELKAWLATCERASTSDRGGDHA